MKTFNVDGNNFCVAFLEGNRKINPNNVKKMEKSLKKFGQNILPMVYVKADDARLNGRKLKMDSTDLQLLQKWKKKEGLILLSCFLDNLIYFVI